MMKTTFVRETPHGIITAESEEAADFAEKEFTNARRRDVRREVLYPGTGREKMVALCHSFPSLKESAKGINPWDTDLFLLWMLRGGGGSGCMHAARFVLQVWSGHADWVKVMRGACQTEKEDPEDSPSSKALAKSALNLRKEIRADLEDCERQSAKEYERKPRSVSDSEVEKVLEEWLARFHPFNVTDAISSWDQAHRQAFLTWCEFPFWP